MILNNLRKILLNSITCKTYNITLIDGTDSASCTWFEYPQSGSTTIVSNSYAGGNTCTTTTRSIDPYGAYSLTFGNGTTEPTVDDYQMESPYDTTNHFSWGSINQSSVETGFTKTITGTISNISEEDLTISEIGVVAIRCYYSGSSLNIAGNHTLIARSLITPVTIAPNETKTFQYTLDLSGIAG